MRTPSCQPCQWTSRAWVARQSQEDSMTSIKFLGAALVLSALVATPASAGGTASEPAAALAQDPTYSNAGAGFSRAMASQVPLGDASGLRMSVRPHRGNHISGVKRY